MAQYKGMRESDTIASRLKSWIEHVLDVRDVALEHPQNIDNGDFSTNIAALMSKGSVRAPAELAREYVDKLATNPIPEVDRVEFAEPLFINIHLSKEFFRSAISAILGQGRYVGHNKSLSDERYIIEYTDPNPFKDFHIGHLMSNAIGESIARLIEANGAEVKRANYQGDIGIHTACAVWAMRKHGAREASSLEESVKYLGECYAEGAQAYAENENAKTEIQTINSELFARSNSELQSLYEWGRKASLENFERIYARLGTKFDFYFFESELITSAKEIVAGGLASGVFEESDGAVVFHAEKFNEKLHTRVFQNKMGLPVYESKDLALAKRKAETYDFSRAIVITASEVDEYFKVLLCAMSQIFPDIASRYSHLSHGMMKLSGGKMSSRKGSVITAMSLLADAEEGVRARIVGKGFSPDDGRKVERVVAIGAVKFAILRHSLGSNIIYDRERAVSLEGDSGPYIQYTYVRAKSVIAKAHEAGIEASSELWPSGSESVYELERILVRYAEVVERASRERRPHHVAGYLLTLSFAFNAFYQRERVVEVDNKDSSYRVALCIATANILRSGLDLLGINVVEKM